MKMSGYTKLFGSIITSTIWREKNETRILWITMLAMKNKDGLVVSSIPGLADMARLSIEDTLIALEKLKSPDVYSNTKEHEGRRIQDADGGWFVLNHEKWRQKMNADERREYLRLKQREHRQRRVNNGQQKSTPSTHTDPDAYTDTEEDKKKNTTPAASVVFPDSLKTPEFEAEWKAFKQHRRRLKCPLTDNAERLTLNRLAKRPQDAVAALQMAQEAGWKSIEWHWFDDRQNPGKGKTSGNTKPDSVWTLEKRIAAAYGQIKIIREDPRKRVDDPSKQTPPLMPTAQKEVEELKAKIEAWKQQIATAK